MTHNWEEIGWNVWSWGDILVVEKSESSEPVGTSSNRIDFRTEPVFVDDDFQPRWILKKSNRLLPRHFSIRVLDLKITTWWRYWAKTNTNLNIPSISWVTVTIGRSQMGIVFTICCWIPVLALNFDITTGSKTGSDRKWDRKYLFIIHLTISLINIILFLGCRLCCFDLTWWYGPAKNLGTVGKKIAPTERIIPILLLIG